MQRRRPSKRIWAGLVGGVFLFFPVGWTAETVTLLYENTGEESGITTPGATGFSVLGSTWSGGVVATEAIQPLYASGAYSYEILSGGGKVVFDDPVDAVSFFYVHGFGFSEGTATAFDSAGGELGSASSRMATTRADSANFVTLDFQEPIARVEFSSGVIDDFAFTLVESPPPIDKGDLTVELEEVAAGLSSPVSLAHAGDGSGRVFVVDQVGMVYVVRDGVLLPEPFLNIQDTLVSLSASFDERGLLGLAFHPDYASNGRFFVRYSVARTGEEAEPCTASTRGCHKEVLAEYGVSDESPDRANPASGRILFEVNEPEFNHNAGAVAFGPDGYLYFSLGDGGGANDGLDKDPPPHGPIGNGQNIHTPLGALLRIDVDGATPYAIPADNPFVDAEGLDEIWAYGFRNPFQFSFDRATGELFLADVGQNLFEEINVVERGGNYGWALREGAHCFDPRNPETPPRSCATEGLIDPIAEYDHGDGLSVIGGFVYRGTTISDLVGKYVFGDFSRDFSPSGRLFYLDAAGDRSTILELRLGTDDRPLGLFLKGFGQDEAGELYVLASSELGPLGTGGTVLRIVDPTGGQPQVPGDCNQDGALDISDALCVFGVLFLGSPGGFPCGDGSPQDPSNVALVDWQSDDDINISDGIALLQFLFAGGPPHALTPGSGSEDPCVPLLGCPPSLGCQ